MLAVQMLGWVGSALLSIGTADPDFKVAALRRRCVGGAGCLQRGDRCLADGGDEFRLTAINVFYIVRLLRVRHDPETFEVVEISPRES